MQLIFSLGGLIVWYVGGRDVLDGKMTLGSLMAFLAYLAMFYTPLATLSQFTTWLTNFLTGCQRVFELLDTPVDIDRPADPEPTARRSRAASVRERDVRLRAASAGAPRRRLRDQPRRNDRHRRQERQRQDDAGQSALPVLRRERRPRAGRRRRRAPASPPHELRRHIGVVLQEPFLFRGTIWETWSTACRRARPSRRSPRPRRPRPTTSSSTRRWATTPGSASAAPAFPAASGSGCRSPGRSCTIRRSWCSTKPPAASTPRASKRSSRRSKR